MIANTKTYPNPQNLVCLRSSDRKIIYQAFVKDEPKNILTWRGDVYEGRTRTYASDGQITFYYTKVESEDVSNIATPPAIKKLPGQ